MYFDLMPVLSVPCKSYHSTAGHCWTRSFMGLLVILSWPL